jgi:hypothetical protein
VPKWTLRKYEDETRLTAICRSQSTTGLLAFRVKEVLQSRLERTVGVFREAHVESLNDILVRQHMRKSKAQM